MANPEEGMYKEAMAAVDSGDRAHARDLFTRLLKLNQNKVEYWLWMSAMVETPRERVYCLQEVLRRDPHNGPARRGMQIAGIAPPDPSQVVPLRLQKRNWEAAILGDENPEKVMAARSLRLTLGVAGALVLVAVLVVAGVMSARRPKYGIVYVTQDVSYHPSATYMPTSSPVVRSVTPTFVGPTPLWMQMQATYTPTPLYVNTPHAASEAYRIALRAYARADWAGLEQYMNQVVTVQPKAADVLYYLGEAERFQGRNTSAIGYYNQAIGLDANFAPAYVGRARARLADDRSAREEPLADLKQAIQKDPQLAEAYMELAALDLSDRRYEDALNLLDQAAGLLPDSPLVAVYRGQALLQLGRVKDGLAEAQRASDLDFTLLPAYRLLGEALLADGQASAAYDPLKTYTTYVLDDAGAFVLLARAQAGKDNFDGALQAYAQALKLNSRLFEAYFDRGNLYYSHQVYDQAAEDFAQAVSLDKSNYQATLNLGQADFMLKVYGDAYVNFERANGLAETDRQKAEVLYWRGQSLVMLDKIDPALRDFKALLKLPKDVAEADWIAFAATQVASLATPTNTPVTPTLTNTPRPTNTPVTPTRTNTPRPTNTAPTPTASQTRQPTRTSTPTSKP
jgi:tetratricopeptide (TPR) repeat protein